MTPLAGHMAPLLQQFGPLIWILPILGFLDLVLKGWGMWRAARMNKVAWFVLMLIFNTLAILPAVFLLITNEEYKKLKTVK